jgi:hypothetical protein
MKTHHKIALGIATATLAVIGYNAIRNKHIGPPEAYPNPQYTPGLIATTDFNELTQTSSCGTYSKCHRLTTSNMKSQVCSEYPANCTGTQEIDHFCPLALGCADDVKNLWAEPEHIMVNGFDYGFHTKDALEDKMVLLIKAGKITPADAQQCILTDWVKCYQIYVATQSFGGFTPMEAIDPDM